MKWERRKIAPKQVLQVIRGFRAPTTNEIKNTLRTDSSSIRRPLGALLYHDIIFPMAYKGGIVWIERTGKRGRPDPTALRKAAGYGTPRQEGSRRRGDSSAVTPPGDSNRSTLSDKERKRLEREFLDE